MKTLVLYGIPNCDTVRKARAWLAEQGVPHAFHDFKKSGVPPETLARWLDMLGHQDLVNRRGTTWRQLDSAEQAAVAHHAAALKVLSAHPSVIRRPVVEWTDGRVTAGFDATEWAQRCKTPPNA